jgi:hypothetical protein
MNGIYRGVTVFGLVVVSFVGPAGSTAPAQAGFADSAAVSTTIETLTVAAPTQVEAKAVCVTIPGTGGVKTTVQIKWRQSTSPDVSGYLIIAYPVDGPSYELAFTEATGRLLVSTDENLVSSSAQFTVTTLTTYGWTAESVRTEPLTC